MLQKLWQVLLTIIYPPFCLGCQRMGTYLCKHCFELCVFHPFPIKINLEPRYLDSLSAPLEFTGPLVKLIHEYKYKNVKPIGKLLAQILFYTADFPPPDLITWVPLHFQRQQERGFNQAQEIAQHLASLCQIPAQPLLIRQRPTTSQAKLKDRALRLKHLANCFKPSTSIGTLPKSVLLVDDVTTTGTTLNEAAKVLKEMGVKQVFGLVVAHGN